MNAFVAFLKIDLKLALRNRAVLFFNYLFPLIFFFAFAELFHAGTGQGASGRVGETQAEGPSHQGAAAGRRASLPGSRPLRRNLLVRHQLRRHRLLHRFGGQPAGAAADRVGLTWRIPILAGPGALGRAVLGKLATVAR